jgi:TolB-like protein/Flp pilus assembly protein TadD
VIETGPSKHGRRAPPNNSEAGLAPDAVQAQLEKVLSSKVFAQSARLSSFLSFIVEWAIQNKGDQIKEYLLGTEVFGRRDTYDPRIDPVVRVEARRLRNKLKEYYETEGRGDPIAIDLPKGGYAPVFREKVPAQGTDLKVQPAPVRLSVGRHTIIPAVLLLLIGVVAYYWTTRGKGGVRYASIAVLPLENLSADPEQEYFSDGMTDALITELANIRSLRVISRTSVMTYKKTRGPLLEIAQKLGVEYVVEGTVQRDRERVRITAQLIEALGERHLWAESYEGDLTDILDLQSRITRNIAQKVRIQLVPQDEARLQARRHVPREAFEAYVKGRYYWNQRSVGAVWKSKEYYHQAIEKDPSYALAYAALGDSHLWFARGDGRGRVEFYNQAKAAASKAVALDESLAEAHTTLAGIASFYEWNWNDAEREFQRAIQLNPNYGQAYQLYGEHLANMGRIEEALTVIRQAQDLDPLSPALPALGGRVFYFGRKYDDAIAQFRQALDMNPGLDWIHLDLGKAYVRKGMFTEAISELQTARTIMGNRPKAISLLGYAYAVSGQRRDAEKALADLEERRSWPDPWPVTLLKAIVYVGLDEKGRALDWLEKAYEDHSALMEHLKVEPIFDDLRSEPRFIAIIKKMHLD